MLSQQTIRNFQEIWERDYGKKLTDKEASRLAHATVRYFETLAQIKARSEVMQNDK